MLNERGFSKLYFLNCKHFKATVLAFARVPIRNFSIEEHMPLISKKHMFKVTSTVYFNPGKTM